MILDSNLIILAAQPQHAWLQEFIQNQQPSVSAISLVEVFGYHRLEAANRTLFEGLFAVTKVLPLNDAVIFRAAGLRATHKMSLGDCLIAATALVFGHALLTHNPRDFANIPGLAVSDPLAAGEPPG